MLKRYAIWSIIFNRTVIKLIAMIKSQFVSTAIYSDESDDYKELTLKL